MKENKIQFFYIDIMALGSRSPTRVIEQKLQYALLNATGCSMTTPGIQAINFDTIPSRYMKGRGTMKGIRQETQL